MPRKGRKRSSTPAVPIPKSEASIIIDKLGNNGLVLLLLETPSGFALFNVDGVQLFLPGAAEHIWANYIKDYTARLVIWPKEFMAFKDKSNAFKDNGINSELAQLIKKWHLPGQLLAVGKEEHKTAIEQNLKISCLCNVAVMEVMWGIKYQMKALVPMEEAMFPREERLKLCYGIKAVLKRHGFIVKPDMVVNERIIDTACVLYDCDLCETKHADFLRSAGMRLKEVSGIEYEGWSLMKIAKALRVLCDPEKEHSRDGREVMFSKDELLRLKTDARLYDGKLLKCTCLSVYNEMVWARGVKVHAKSLLKKLIYEAGVPPGRGVSSSDPSVLEVDKQEGSIKLDIAANA